MKTIELTQGLHAIVDDDDFAALAKHKWTAQFNKSRTVVYAIRESRAGRVYMHRLLAGAGRGEVVDHVNRNGLDNRRKNLRLVTRGQNKLNSPLPKNNKSGFRGVTFDAKKNRWRAFIGYGGALHYLGSFENVEDAARAYDEAATLHHGEFANLNLGIE